MPSKLLEAKINGEVCLLDPTRNTFAPLPVGYILDQTESGIVGARDAETAEPFELHWNPVPPSATVTATYAPFPSPPPWRRKRAL